MSFALNGHTIREQIEPMAGHLHFSKRMAAEFREKVKCFEERKKEYLRERMENGKNEDDRGEENP